MTSTLAFTEGVAATISVLHSASGTLNVWIDTDGSGAFDAVDQAFAELDATAGI